LQIILAFYYTTSTPLTRARLFWSDYDTGRFRPCWCIYWWGYFFQRWRWRSSKPLFGKID